VVSTLALAHSDNSDLDAATKGDSAAQLRLAKAYQFGEGQTRDIREAVRWYYAAAAQGNAEAAYMLGVLAYNGDVLGDNVRGSDVQAWVWFDAADIAGYPDAAVSRDRTGSDLVDAKLKQAHELAATLFLNGGRFPAHPDAAIKELEWLDVHNSSGGTLLLASLYTEGRQIPKDLDKAKALCEKAVKQQYGGAHYCLAQIQSENGNAGAAFELIKKDAEAIYPTAMVELAKRYRDGNGTKADPIAAYTWVLRCDAIKVPACAQLKQEFASQLSNNDQNKAQTEAAKMRLKNGVSIMEIRRAAPAIITRPKN
jgi:TPR repeat protein